MIASLKAGPRPDDALRCIARRMADAIDHAVDCGMFDHADRLAANALRLTINSTRLADCVARLRLKQNDPEAAMAIIDACSKRSASMRLLRIACLLQLGRTAESHLALNEWSAHSTAPLAARCMLALLDAAVGDCDGAATALSRNLKQVEDPATLELFTILSAAAGRSEQAAEWAQRLRRASIVSRATIDIDLLCDSLDMPVAAVAEPVAPSPLQVATLAMELAASPQSLPVLVKRQEEQLQPMVAELLYRAAQDALIETEESAAVYEALARLAQALGRTDDAVEWARHGLNEHPMSAPLALLLARLQEASTETVPRTPSTRKAA